jgi:hypothetical protein
VDLNATLDPVESRQYKFMDEKPPYSYATLIIFAINSSYQKKLTLSQIYDWIISNFAYYKDTHTGWKNSIRHNLSLNKCFRKVSRPKGETGKGAYWEIDHNAIPRRIQEGDRPPLTPDSTSSDPKISPGPSPTLNELYQSNSSYSSGEFSPMPWEVSNPPVTRPHSTFYSPSQSGGHFISTPQHHGVQDSSCYQTPPQTAFVDYGSLDPSESFSNFYSLLNNSLSLSDNWKLPSPDMPLGASAGIHGTPLTSSLTHRHFPPEVTNVIQIAEDIRVNQSFEPGKIEKLNHAFSQVQPSQLGMPDKDFDLFANSFRKFIDSWHRSPHSSLQGNKSSWRHNKPVHTAPSVTYSSTPTCMAHQYPRGSAAATSRTPYVTGNSPIISDVSIFSEVTRTHSRPVPLNEIQPTLPPVSEDIPYSSADDAFQRAFENALNN